MEDHSPEALREAKRLRREMTLPEVLLWRLLQQRPKGLKFRRQHPIGNKVVLDFNCAKSRMAIEVDGQSHDMGDLPERDLRRDAWLRSKGIQVVHIPAVDVLRSAEDVVESLIAYCAAMPPPSALRAATSPKGGGFNGIA